VVHQVSLDGGPSAARSAYLLNRQAAPVTVMRRQIWRFSAGVISGQRCTSSKVRPQPLQLASPWHVEQIAMQGVSGWVSYHAFQAA
jgi:hypothetical protein